MLYDGHFRFELALTIWKLERQNWDIYVNKKQNSGNFTLALRFQGQGQYLGLLPMISGVIWFLFRLFLPIPEIPIHLFSFWRY